MIIRYTQKLLSELKQPPVETAQDDNPLWSWHGNLLLIERRKCVLIVNDATRFAVFIPFLRKPDFLSFKMVFGQNLFKILLQENFAQEQIEAVLSEAENIQFAKSNNRSVLGTLNELSKIIEYSVASEGGLDNLDIYKLNHDLNRLISSAIAYKRPIELFQGKLEEVTSKTLA